MNLVFHDEIRSLSDRLIEGWKKADVSGLEDLILPDAYVDFDIFEKGIDRNELLRKLSERPRKTDYVRFETLNNIVVKGKSEAIHGNDRHFC